MRPESTWRAGILMTGIKKPFIWSSVGDGFVCARDRSAHSKPHQIGLEGKQYMVRILKKWYGDKFSDIFYLE
jgi:hypothetical protein